MAALGVVTGGLAAAGPEAHVASLGIGAAAAALGTAAGNALNDALDAATDRAAHPRRPVPRGSIPPSQAAGWAASALALALVAAAFTNFWALLLASLLAINLLAYEFAWKARGISGNLVVGYNVGALFVLGGLCALAPPLTYGAAALEALVGGGRILPALVMAVLAGVLNFAREILKDAEDTIGDAAARRTFAVRHGPHAAVRLGNAVAWLAIPIALAPVPMGIFGSPYLALLSPLITLLLVVPFAGSAGTQQRLLKIGMGLGFLPFLAQAFI